VVTGVGVIAPNGATTEAFWRNCLGGTAAVAPLPEHWRAYYTPTSTLWAPLPPLDIDKLFVNRIERMQIDQATLLGLGACRQALQGAGLSLTQVDEKKNTFSLGGIAPTRCGVYMGTGMCGIASFATAQGNHLLAPIKERLGPSALAAAPSLDALLRVPPRFNPFIVPMVMPNACAASIGIKLSLTGPNRTFCQACSAGAFAIGEALRAIRAGSVDCAIAGGTEFLGDEYGGVFRGFDIARTLVRDCSVPDKANRPFDKRRSGFLFAEGGAAVLCIESREHALQRGARPLCEISAFAESYDAHSLMAIDPQGTQIEAVLRAALEHAGIGASEVDYVNAHATGTELNDEVEAAVIARVFGAKPVVNATKSLIGHTVGAAGAIEAAVTALSIRDQTVHACKNLDDPLRDLNFVRQTAPCAVRHALTQSFAFGGHNAAIVMRSCN
jgi:3-oxoacyl-[acyl-carrier-protein] synthase II